MYNHLSKFRTSNITNIDELIEAYKAFGYECRVDVDVIDGRMFEVQEVFAYALSDLYISIDGGQPMPFLYKRLHDEISTDVAYTREEIPYHLRSCIKVFVSADNTLERFRVTSAAFVFDNAGSHIIIGITTKPKYSCRRNYSDKH